MAQLILQNLTRHFGDIIAVDDVSFTVGSGEFVALLGPSGSGKTTILRLIGGFEEASSGQILINDRDVQTMPPHKRNIGVVFQKYALFPHMTVLENVAYPLRRRSVPKCEIHTRAKEALTTVGLEMHDDRYPRQLSGGQQQRVALARAMVFKPEIILMDEPLGALDKQLREHMQFEIRRLQQNSGITAIYVTHDQTEAIAMADRIGVVNCGKLEQLDTAAEIYNHPNTQFVAEFIGSSNLLPIERHTANGEVLEVEIAGGTRFRCLSANTTEPTMFMVRPERIKLRPRGSEPSDANTIDGKILRKTFLGEKVDFCVGTSVGDIHVHCADADVTSGCNVGDRIQLSWGISECTVVGKS